MKSKNESNILLQPCLPSLLPFIFRARTWTGRGGGGAIRKSTGWDLSLPQRNQMGFRKERRKACGLRLFLWKNRRLVVLRSAALPPRPCPGSEGFDPLMFLQKGRVASLLNSRSKSNSSIPHFKESEVSLLPCLPGCLEETWGSSRSRMAYSYFSFRSRRLCKRNQW